MTLDDLIEALQEIRRACPAAGSATCVGFLDRIRYDKGEVLLSEIDPALCQVIEIVPPQAPRTGSVH